MRQEVIILQRQILQYQQLLQEANEAKKVQLDVRSHVQWLLPISVLVLLNAVFSQNNVTVRQQQRENHAQLLQQIKHLREQVFARVSSKPITS